MPALNEASQQPPLSDIVPLPTLERSTLLRALRVLWSISLVKLVSVTVLELEYALEYQG